MATGEEILSRLSALFGDLDQRDPESIDRLTRITLQARRVFLLGAGRSGLVGRAFAMRLMHLGLQAYVAGESTTPGLEKGDLVIIVSGSGRTASIVAMTDRIAGSGADLFLLTASPQSPLQEQCSGMILIPCRDHPEDCAWLPLGSLFEVSCFLFLESAVAAIRQQLGVSHQEMRCRHSILE